MKATAPDSKAIDSTNALSIDSPTLLESFIHECLLVDNTNPLHKAIQLTRYALSRTNSLTKQRASTLDTLTRDFDKPITIAIVGQFSSGKSTFLNAIMGRAILPSGITPITSKVCTICYGDTYSLEVIYNDGTSAPKPLEFFHTLDELENLQIREFILRAPVALLRSISLLDTPGFNSQNAIDTETTNAILSRVDGIIWLSLIDNVGKQSEKDIIEAHIKQYISKSLCVLNQKDRLQDEKEVQTSLDYARSAFSGSFSEVIAISAKQALKAIQAHQEQPATPLESSQLYAHSNFQAVLEFITAQLASNAKELKSSKTLRTLGEILALSIAEIEQAQSTTKAYLQTIECFDSTLRFNALKSGLEKQFSAFFTRYDNALENLAQYIFSQLESSEFSLPITSKNLLGMRTQQMQAYQATIIPKDTLISKLHSQENRFLPEFRTLGLQIGAFGKELGRFLDSELEALKQAGCELWADSTPALQHTLQTLQHSTLAHIQAQNTAALCALQGELDSLKALITLNYPNAISLALIELDSKINYALHKHKQSPKDFALFTPTLENIRDSLNNALHFLTFQDRLSLHNALYKRTLWSLSQAYMECFEHAAELITPHLSTLESHIQALRDALEELQSHH